MTSRTRALVAGVGAGIVVVGVVVLILVVGFIPVPEYPSLAEAPDPGIPGVIAYSIPTGTEEEHEFDERCISVTTAATGEADELLCRDGLGFGVVWADDGRVVTEDYGPGFDDGEGGTLLVVDPSDGSAANIRYEDEPSFLWSDQRRRRDDGARLDIDHDDARVIVRRPDGSTTVLFEPDKAPTNYEFFEPQWSPDGRFVLVADTEGRLIVLRAEGDPQPRVVVVTDHEGHDLSMAWYIEGNPTYTVDAGLLDTG